MKKLFTKSPLTGAAAIIIYIMLANFVLHITTGLQYGLFSDENYYYAMSNHLDFGYVDVTPITAWLMALSRLLLGDSNFAMRIFPALAGSFTILFASLAARKMGGGKLAQVLTALVVMLAPMYTAVFSMFIYDAFDQLMSAVVVFMAAKILRGEDAPKTWVLFGLLIGIGVMVKITMGFLVISLAAGLLLTSARKYFARKWLWISAAVAFACFIPYIVWQFVHDFPIAYYLSVYTRTRTLSPPVWQLLLNIWLSFNPLTIVLWLSGLITLFTKRGRPFRAFGWAFLFYFAIAAVLYIKFYALGGVMLPLTAFGAVCLEKGFRSSPKQLSPSPAQRKSWLPRALKASYVSLICATGLALAPLNMPVLSPADTAAYNRAVGFSRYVRWETVPSPLPMLLSNRLGWEELASRVSDIYCALPESDRKNCAVLCSNYGEVGALEYYSKAYALPQAIGGQLSCYYWGYGNYDGTCLIIAGMGNVSSRILEYIFDDVTPVKGPHADYASYYENDIPIYICRGLKISLDEFWESFRSV